MKFSEKLGKLIDSKNRYASALARFMEVSPQTIKNWRDGDFEPSLAAMAKLAKHFEVPLGWLVDSSDHRDLEQVEREEGWLRSLRRLDLETAERRIVGAHEDIALDPSEFEQPPRRSRKAE